MIALLENHKEAIAELCLNYSVQRFFRLKQADMQIYSAQNCSVHCRAIDLLLFWNPQRRPSERKDPKWGLAFGSLAGRLEDI
jgi:hypothetical protein